MHEKKPRDSSDSGTGVHGKPNPDAAPGQSSASGWDRDKSKPSGRQHDDKGQEPADGKQDQQNPMLTDVE